MKYVVLAVLIILLLSTSQAPPPPESAFEDSNSSLVPCSAEESRDTSAGLNYFTNLYQKSIQLLFVSPEETNSIAPRDVSSDAADDKKKSPSKIYSFALDVACITGVVLQEAGSAFGGLFKGIFGAVAIACEHKYYDIKRAWGEKTTNEESSKNQQNAELVHSYNYKLGPKKSSPN
ncbi:uncharacterized protein LOC135842719 [Planococcus citri]|uniref:uncharacterized protein LOC135842719 n=1 Tax=Planococcus citri TaxID=170843 RepID=UPI0031F99C1C